MFVKHPVTGKMIRVYPGRVVTIKSNARIGSHWPRNHGVRYMSK